MWHLEFWGSASGGGREQPLPRSTRPGSGRGPGGLLRAPARRLLRFPPLPGGFIIPEVKWTAGLGRFLQLALRRAGG